MKETNIPHFNSPDTAPIEPEPRLEVPISPDEAEHTNEISLLYPNVQHVMDDLKKIVEENADTIEYTDSGEPIIPLALFRHWFKEAGFGNRVRGTFNNENTYLYVKSCNIVNPDDDIDKTLATARHLTNQGVIHPASQWGVYRDEDDDSERYQLFVVSPKLEAYSLNKQLSGEYQDREKKPTLDNAHLVKWFQRVDPDFTLDRPIPEESLLHHLNWTEASDPTNWGWDATGELFPVDVEVLRPNKPGKYVDPEPWKPKQYNNIELF